MKVTSRWVRASAALLGFAVAGAAYGADASPTTPPTGAESGGDVAGEIRALKARIAQLEEKQSENWLNAERTEQIKSIVQGVLADSKYRMQAADGPTVGYNNGFFIQSADGNFKLVVGGFIQARYEYAYHHTGGSYSSAPMAQGTQGNASGFDIRRARINFSGNVFSPDLTYKFEGDFYGNSSGGFTVSDAFLGYRFSDLFKLRAGSFKVPFTKAELVSDTTLEFQERPEVNNAFDALRALGVSLYGDIIKDQLNYEINANDGANSNTLRRVDTNNPSTDPTNSKFANNLDNRMAFYGRLNWSPSGSISEIMSGEADLRDAAKGRPFVWMLGGAVGYESQNSQATAFPSPQTTTSVPGIGNNNGPGFKTATLNGDLFRATVDWSAKYEGWAFNTAAYFQQLNANPGASSSALPYGASKASFFEHGYYGQVGYMITPKLEVDGRAGVLLTEGDPNIGEFYSVGANYYLYGNNAKIQTDVTYTPEAAYTDTATSLIQNTHEVVFRVQLQLKF